MTLRLAAAALALALGGLPGPASAEITRAGHHLADMVDSLDVERHWPAGQHIDWETGMPDGRPEGAVGKHTHCSAFVAAAAKRLGIYILRPPEHARSCWPMRSTTGWPVPAVQRDGFPWRAPSRRRTGPTTVTWSWQATRTTATPRPATSPSSGRAARAGTPSRRKGRR